MPAKNKNKKENKKAETPRRNPGATPARPGLSKRLKSALPPNFLNRGKVIYCFLILWRIFLKTRCLR